MANTPAQSASSIYAFKRCPILYHYRHDLRLRPIEESERLRIGTHWHKCLEILCNPEVKTSRPLLDYLQKAYASRPDYIDENSWVLEAVILYTSALAWRQGWTNVDIETVAVEVPFRREIYPGYIRRGRIDRIIRRDDRLLLSEYKSTSSPIDPGSDYWAKLRLDSQPTLYLIEARHAQLAGELEQYGISASDPLISGVLYDVWRKPTIRPKKLTQAESKKFVDSGLYFCQEFQLANCLTKPNEAMPTGQQFTDGPHYIVDDEQAEITPGKKEGTFAIRETPKMFGARLQADMRDNFEHYFARKEIVRTNWELAQADEEYTKLARLVDITRRRDLWFRNEQQCDLFGKCEFYQLCMHGIDVESEVPAGFKRVGE